MISTEREFKDLQVQAKRLESTIQKLQADLHNSYRDYQRLSEKAFRNAAESMRDACIKQAVALARAGVPPEKFEEVLGQIPVYPAHREDISDIQES